MAGTDHIQAKIDAAVAAERERCALIVERYSLPTIQIPSMWLVDKAAIAREIRNPHHDLPFHQETMDGLRTLTIRKELP